MSAGAGTLLERFRSRRFRILFGALLLALAGAPLLRELGLPALTIELLMLLVLLLAGLGRIGLGRGIAVGVLAALFALSRAIQVIHASDGILTAGDLLWALAFALAGVSALGEAIREGAVTSERLFAATSVYLLMGLAFAAVYQALEQIRPGSLAVAGSSAASLDLQTAVYFSFVTLATLGYGDVVPVSPIARSLAILEAVGAQLFVAVMIARLVSLGSRRET